MGTQKLSTVAPDLTKPVPAPVAPEQLRAFEEIVTSRGVCDNCQTRRAEIPLGEDRAYCRQCYAAVVHAG